MKVIDSQIRFVVNIDCNIPNALIGDEIRIRQVLLNILSNAVKYTENGYVSFVITGEVYGNILNLVIEVADSGRGIKQEDIDKLFGDFVQLNLANNRGIEGTGLGLAISQSLVKAMGGEISVISEYGEGSTFTITLPQTIRDHTKLASVKNPAEKRVLVYENREIYSNSIVCSIANLDVNCTLVSTDSEFSEELASGVYTFVFIASNLYEKARDICASYQSQVKIVLLTGFGEPVANQGLRILAMPVHSISVANVLNDEADSFFYSGNSDSPARFSAPDANILIVDDIDTNLIVAEGLLSPYGMRVTLCKSGQEAIEAVSVGDADGVPQYDLILMDHMMPEMDGIEATRLIRAMAAEKPFFGTVPVIALTANAVSGTKEMFLENGFNDFLSKPIDTTKLDVILEKWIPKEKQISNALKSSPSVTVASAVEKAENTASGETPIALLLRELSAALESKDAGKIDGILEKVNLRMQDQQTKKALEEMYDDVLMNEFDNAIKNVKDLLASLQEFA